MDNKERLVLASALKKKLDGMTSTKDPDSLRGQVDGELLAMFEETGADRLTVMVNGEKIATLTLCMSEAQPSRIEYAFDVDDYVLLAKWFDDVTDAEVREYVALNLRDFAEFKWHQDGEVAYGCRVRENVIPAKPSEPTHTLLRFDADKVLQAMLPAGVSGLLEAADGD